MTVIFGQGVSNIAFLKDQMKVANWYSVGGPYYKLAVPGMEEQSLFGTKAFNDWIRANAAVVHTTLKDQGQLRLTQGEIE